ncbi:MAG: cytidine deaminase [Parcubacteria group bacterium CG1_02_37_51]|uniref:Cytidine deaminase n=2 Tax=Candidatus Komeiliibacteriota TaxID=1817908 RepID=A0A2M8DQN3_9BACT|nr:MAG: cytidine deaminase [Parcubacteria group bacterium CG1_02_37_51]PIY95374.1 MAG: cytidine deaminase [Candidatus Komeilibacteria bacterium CG_4_10_14_0_8_um_filter_37_78]PJC01430.1 MAG: cytidine deaminase [Candidatus Komeilibacteria bacterium CG_4_9_14_0_8_um_filter_36_9]
MDKNLILNWDETFMQLVKLIALRSKDPNTKTGAVIVDDNKIVVGLGYNGWVRGVEESDFPWEREGDFLHTKYAYVVHAESNTIFNSNKSVKGCTLYCDLFPCNECSKIIVQNGIKEIIYNTDKYHDEDIWIASRNILDKPGVKYRQYQSEYELELIKKKNE